MAAAVAMAAAAAVAVAAASAASAASVAAAAWPAAGRVCTRLAKQVVSYVSAGRPPNEPRTLKLRSRLPFAAAIICASEIGQ